MRISATYTPAVGLTGTIVCASVAALFVGCAGPTPSRGELISSTPTAPSAQAVAEADAEWVLVRAPGAEAVVIVPRGTVEALRGTRMSCADGGVLDVEPLTLIVRPQDADRASAPTSVAARMGWWLGLSSGGRAGVWSAGAPLQSGPQALRVRVIRAGDHESTRAEVGGQRVGVRWLDAVPTETADPLQGRVLGEEAMESSWVRGSLAMMDLSPLTRWRARLARGELFVAQKPTGVFSDGAIEAMANGVEAQWRYGLARLARHDAALARRVAQELCRSVDFGGGVLVPGWEPDGPRVDELLERLLTSADDERAAQSASAWLEQRSTLICWVTDDAGATDATTGEPEGALGVANLTGVPLAAWASAESATGATIPAGTEITAVSPHASRRVPAGGLGPTAGSPASLSLEQAIKGQRVRLQAGEVTRTPTIYDARIPAIAPGVRIGPLQPDWRLGAWRDVRDDAPGPWSGALSAADAPWSTTGLLYRGVDAPPGEGLAAPDRWLVYLEVGVEVGAEAPSAEESVRVWLGPLGRSRAVLRVMKDGRVLDESPPADDGSVVRDMPRLARVATTSRGWALWLPVPPGAIEPGGLLRVGVERFDRRGVRWSWPRASLPWQVEPSRIAVNTTGWSERPGVTPPIRSGGAPTGQ